MAESVRVNNREKVELARHESYTEVVIHNGIHNIMDVEVVQDLVSAFSMIQPGIEFIILRSEGKDFSRGFDTSCVRVKEHAYMKEIQDLSFVLRRIIESVDKPVYAVVSGYCLGLAFEIALSCDRIYAAKDSKFGFPDSLFGMPPLTGILQRLGSDYGKPLTDLFFSGEIISSGDPRTSLFSETVHDSGFTDAAISLIEAIDNRMRSYYKGIRKMEAGNPDSYIFNILEPERIRLKELEAFRNNL